MATTLDDDALYLMPAYGRRYFTASAALKAWDEGRDFLVIHSGPYCSKRDLDKIRFDGFHRIILLDIHHKELVRIELAQGESHAPQT